MKICNDEINIRYWNSVLHTQLYSFIFIAFSIYSHCIRSIWRNKCFSRHMYESWELRKSREIRFSALQVCVLSLGTFLCPVKQKRSISPKLLEKKQYERKENKLQKKVENMPQQIVYVCIVKQTFFDTKSQGIDRFKVT